MLFAICASCLCLPVSAWKKERGKLHDCHCDISNSVVHECTVIGHRHTFQVSDVLVPGQKWVNQDDQEQILIDKVSKSNATFAAFYVIEREPTTAFPIRGEYDPEGSTIGWVVSYWNTARNDHAVASWAGYIKMAGEKPLIDATGLIAHEDSGGITVVHDRFMLEEQTT